MIIFLIILGYVVGIFVFANAFNAFFEPAYPPAGKRDGYRYKVRSRITGRMCDIWQACDFDGNECDYPYLRAIFWPITLLIWLFGNGTSAIFENYIEKKHKEFQEKEKLRRQTEKFTREGTLD